MTRAARVVPTTLGHHPGRRLAVDFKEAPAMATYEYRNLNNPGQVVHRDTIWPRGEALANWERAAGADPEPQHEDPPAASPPARSANKETWLMWARSCARDSDEAAAVDGLTKEQLIDQYGDE